MEGVVGGGGRATHKSFNNSSRADMTVLENSNLLVLSLHKGGRSIF